MLCGYVEKLGDCPTKGVEILINPNAYPYVAKNGGCQDCGRVFRSHTSVCMSYFLSTFFWGGGGNPSTGPPNKSLTGYFCTVNTQVPNEVVLYLQISIVLCMRIGT